METNILKAICNLTKIKNNDLKNIYKGSNRANIVGEALEYYIKDLFCDSFGAKDINKKDKAYSKYFSYIGNQNNPPDFIISEGDALEVNKTKGTEGIVLNSPYPKSKLYTESPMITQACRDCEEWQAKDLIYSIGTVLSGKLKLLWMIYGDCFVADKDIYKGIRNKISGDMNELSDMELSDAGPSTVDPLGITRFSLRSSCTVDNPVKIFDYAVPINQNIKFSVKAILSEDKYLSFPKEDRLKIESITNKNFAINNIKIKSPDNPAKLMRAKLLSLEVA